MVQTARIPRTDPAIWRGFHVSFVHRSHIVQPVEGHSGGQSVFLSLLTRSGGGFHLLAVWMLMAFGWSIYMAWVLIAEVSE
jgi:hypothetical protein